ncbi:MAG: c-type cytochrome [Pirellulaceae bacterium]
MIRLPKILVCSALLFAVAQPLFAATPDRPIHAGMTGQEAAAYMSALDGFQVQLAAAEPLVHQPVAFTIDHKGRIWVAEAYTYPIRAPEGQGRDKIVILEDTDLDGTFETRKVFAEGLNLVSGLEVGFGGVWVGAAPYFMFIPDANGDDQPDSEPQILLDGFGYQDTHETLNAFIWGPDGWLYGCHGVFTHSNVGKPGASDSERTAMNAAVWRYHPQRHEFEIFSYGTSNPWGVDFNDHGHPFITACVIPHLWHIVQGARYQRQGGRHFNPYIFEDIQTIAVHRHYAGDIRDHAWWGQEPDAPADTLAAGGGHAHCGAMVYLGDNWPSQYRNQIFMNNIHGNRVNNDKLARKGSGYVGDRAPDILLSNDKWYRGINLKYGPNGSVYLIDWYDKNACHRTNPEIWDRTNGRIYNLAYGSPDRKKVDLESMSNTELIQLHLHQNDWYVRTARRILQHRNGAHRISKSDVASLQSILNDNPDGTRRLRALWTLHALDALSSDQFRKLMHDADEYMRSWAIQLELEDKSVDADSLAVMAQMAEADDSPLVRLYLASALQRLPLDSRWQIAFALSQHAEDTDDHNLPLMYWYGIEPLVTHNTDQAMQLAAAAKIPKLVRFITRRAAVEGSSRNAVVQQLTSAEPAQQAMILDEMIRAFEGQANLQMPAAWQAAYAQLINSADAAIVDKAVKIAVLFGDRRIFPTLRTRLMDTAQPLESRKEALAILLRGQDAGAANAYQAVLSEPALRSDALKALAQVSDAKTPDKILEIYDQLSAAERTDAVGTLTSRLPYAEVLVTALADGRIARTDVHAFHIRQIQSLGNEALNASLEKAWGAIRESSADKQAKMQTFAALLADDAIQNGSRSHGRFLFDKTCGSCHKLFGNGGDVGPDITGSNRTNLDYLLQNIVDPSAVLGKDYQMSVLDLADGRVVSGLIQSETDSAVTIRTINDTQVIPKADIDDRNLSPLSMMPEGLLDTLTPEQIVDLVAYLQSPTQVSVGGPKARSTPRRAKSTARWKRKR